jgi:1-acyl-sn-glycerol-3-phosphate acyltransferase
MADARVIPLHPENEPDPATGATGATAPAAAAPAGQPAAEPSAARAGRASRRATPAAERAGRPTTGPGAAAGPGAGTGTGGPAAGTGTGANAGPGAGAGGTVGEAGPERPEWERAVAGALAFLRRRITGDYEVDEFGFDPDLTEHVLAPPFRPLYSKWFRVEALGMANVPDAGGALVVANHSGTIPLDAVMTTLALLDHHPARRHLRALGADLVFRTPLIGAIARKSGNTLACNPDAERLLSSGELVGVWPEGFKGTGKPYADRYKLQRFGRGGFVGAALRTGVPIIPCSIVGAEETYPLIGNAKPVARLLNLPYFPITPTFPWLGPLGAIPLPSKWLIEFGEPIDTASIGAAAAEDPMLVFNLTDQVRETIQQTLYRLLLQRRSAFR